MLLIDLVVIDVALERSRLSSGSDGDSCIDGDMFIDGNSILCSRDCHFNNARRLIACNVGDSRPRRKGHLSWCQGATGYGHNCPYTHRHGRPIDVGDSPSTDACTSRRLPLYGIDGVDGATVRPKGAAILYAHQTPARLSMASFGAHASGAPIHGHSTNRTNRPLWRLHRPICQYDIPIDG